MVFSLSCWLSLYYMSWHQQYVSKKQGTLTEGKGAVQLTSLYQLVWISYFWSYKHSHFITKQPNLRRRSTVLSIPFQLELPEKKFYNNGHRTQEKQSNPKRKSRHEETTRWIFIKKLKTRDRIHNTSFCSYLKYKPSKLVCFITPH